MYRDGSNYKQYGREVFPGALTEEQVATIWVNTADDDFHILPAQVDLPVVAENFESHYSDDHPWHELLSIEPTDAHTTMTTPVADWFELWVDIEWDEATADARLRTWINDTPKGH